MWSLRISVFIPVISKFYFDNYYWKYTIWNIIISLNENPDRLKNTFL